jgi:hemoglobin
MSDETNKQYGDGDTSFKTAGGEAGLRQLATDFYAIMSRLDEAKTIFDMHPKDIDTSSEKLALFLCGWLGGPKLYREKYGPIMIPKAHSHLHIGSTERDAWLLCMKQALDLQPYPADFKQYMIEQLFVPAERSRNKD